MTQENISIEKEVKTAFKPATIYGIGYIAQNFLFLVSTLLIAKILGTTNFGLYSLALSIVGIGAMLSALGLNVVPSRFIPRYLNKGETSKLKAFISFILGTQGSVSIVIAIILISSAGYISSGIYNKTGLALFIIALSIMMPLQKTTELMGTVFMGFKKIKYSVYVQNWIGPMLRLAFLSLAFFVWRTIPGVFSALYLQVFLTFAILFLVFKNKIWSVYPVETTKNSDFSRKEILAYGLPLFVPYMIAYLMGRLDILLIGYFLSADQVGIYNIVFKLSLIVALSLLSLNSIFSPIISELYSKGEHRKLEHSYKAFTRTILYISFFVLGSILVLGKPLLSIIGPQYIAGTGALFILSIGQLLYVSIGSASKFFSMTEHPRISLYNSIIQLSMNLTLNLLLIPRYGIIGAAFATAISIFTVNLIRLLELWRLFRIHPFSPGYLKPMLSGIIALAAIWMISYIFKTDSPWILFPAFAISYIIMVIILGIGKEERYMISLVRNYTRGSSREQ